MTRYNLMLQDYNTDYIIFKSTIFHTAKSILKNNQKLLL